VLSALVYAGEAQHCALAADRLNLVFFVRGDLHPCKIGFGRFVGIIARRRVKWRRFALEENEVSDGAIIMLPVIAHVVG